MNLGELEAQVLALLAQGHKVEAVKQVRKETGWGLREAKDYVDGLEYAALPALGVADEAAMEQVTRALIQQGRPIEAIRRVRELTNWGLRGRLAGYSRRWVCSVGPTGARSPCEQRRMTRCSLTTLPTTSTRCDVRRRASSNCI